MLTTKLDNISNHYVYEDYDASLFSCGGGGGAGDAGDESVVVDATFVFGGLYFFSSLSLFSFHHSSACCSANLRLLQEIV